MMAPGSALDGLKRRQPEWVPWLAVVEEVLRETGARHWDAAVPAAHAPEPGAPLLAGVAVAVKPGSVRSLLERLIRVAARGGTPKMRSLEGALGTDLDAVTLFRASLCQDAALVGEAAAGCSADAEALQAIVALIGIPFLQACNRRWASSIPASWTEGYCPVCGSWPAFAEVRGIERSRYFRCGRCGGEWHARALSCPYCAVSDHNELVALVPETNHAHVVVEACTRCLGYVKAFTRLQGCPPDSVMLEDLGSVALDVAALEQGHTRPAGAACPLDVTVEGTGARRRFFVWNA